MTSKQTNVTIEIDPTLSEGSEYSLYINGMPYETGFVEYDSQIDDLVEQLALSLQLQGKTKTIRISARAI